MMVDRPARYFSKKLKKALIILFFIWALIIILIFFTSKPQVELIPDVKPYWNARHDWNVKLVTHPTGEEIAVNEPKKIIAEIWASKGPMIEEKGLAGELVIVNNNSQSILLKHLVVDIFEIDPQKNPKMTIIEKQRISRSIIASNTSLNKKSIRRLYFKASFTPRDKAFYVSRYTANIKEYGEAARNITVIKEIKFASKPVIQNRKISIAGPSTDISQGLVVNYDYLRKTFSDNGRYMQEFVVKPLGKSRYFLSLNYTVSDTGQELSTIVKFVSK